MDSSADWGISDPLSVPKTAALMLERGVPEEHVRLVTYQNALDVYGQSGQFNEADWAENPGIDQRQLFSGNSILRGQKAKVDLSGSNLIVE